MTRKHKERLQQLGVSIVYLFGSRATGRKAPSSDTDIGVVFRDFEFDSDKRAAYHALYQLFSELYRDSRLDIVFLQTSPLSLQYSAIKEGKILFENDPIATANYENRTINEYLDFRPVMDFFDRSTMEGHAKAKSSHQ